MPGSHSLRWSRGLLVGSPVRVGILVPLILTALVQVVSGLPHPAESMTASLRSSFGPGPEGLDVTSMLESLFNGLHLPVFAALAFAWIWGLHPWITSPRSRLRLAATVTVAFALANELSQAWIPTRYASLGDVAANLVGIGLGLGAWAWLDTRSGDHRISA